MDAVPMWIIALLALAAGLLAGWAWGRARGAEGAARERSELAQRAVAAEAAADGLRTQLVQQAGQYRELLDRTRTDTAVREERERREQAVLRALAPVQEALGGMQRKVEDLERDRRSQFGALEEQLRQARVSDDQLRETTASLAGALRSGATRGVWGETQLRRVVEAAGLTRHVDFELQASVMTDAGAGRPDMIVRLPGGKALAVDAKAPLDAFLEASAIAPAAVGEEASRRQTLLGAHARAVRGHVDALARKTYWAGLPSSPEFVVCFIPGEALLSAALEEDPTLLEYAFRKRVALASPVSLWSVLKTVAYVWTQQDVAEQAKELFRLGNELYGRLSTVAEHADRLRRAIESTVGAYNAFAGSLESRVLVTARRFPGIDDTKLETLAAPGVVTSAPRHLTALELIPSADDDEAASTGSPEPAAVADLGELRDRLAHEDR